MTRDATDENYLNYQSLKLFRKLKLIFTENGYIDPQTDKPFKFIKDNVKLLFAEDENQYEINSYI